ncbi:VOC family protein [Paenibacillus sp. An7]|uniref:VOC family protein n=1 Tax=Paenibacillus sp. An7 TaxID=2689577 RepID=UPI001357AA0A|nr:ring-cleaving dioxygenase [Paenibacillus sp. An7]
MIFEEVILNTHELKDLKTFYVHTLGFGLVKEDTNSFTVTVGETNLTFVITEEKKESPFYHFAVNINEDKFKLAKAYLSERVTLLKDESQDEFEFESWNAHAVYFCDPAGNIVEFIARHNLKSNSISSNEFTMADILCVSEVGLPVPHVESVVSALEADMNLPLWKGDRSTFQPVGDEHGLFIVVVIDRIWLPTSQKATIFPVTIKIKDNDIKYKFANLPYQII